MKNSLKLILGLVFVVSLAFIFTSCAEENIDEIVKEVENIPDNSSSTNTAMIEFQGDTTITDAYAAYCNKNNQEFLVVTNNQALLSSTSINWIDESLLNDGDYYIAHMIDTLAGGMSQNLIAWKYMDATQTPVAAKFLLNEFQQLNFSVDPVLNEVKGNMSGTLSFDGVPPMGPFTINFDASIIQTHAFCN